MGLKGLLLGHEVKVYYDRHLTKTEKAEDAENPSEYEILKGVVNGVYKDMILISYSYRENVQTTKKGLFSEKAIEEEKTVEAHSLINRKCIVRIDILDLNLEEEEEEYDEESLKKMNTVIEIIEDPERLEELKTTENVDEIMEMFK